MTRRNGRTDGGKAGGAAAAAVEELIGRRAQTLYVLAEKVQELAASRAAVQAAQEAERAAYAAAVQTQEAVVSAGWSVQELRDAALYVGAPAVRRRRRTGPATTGDAAPDAAATSLPGAPRGAGDDADAVSGGAVEAATVGAVEGAGPVGETVPVE